MKRRYQDEFIRDLERQNKIGSYCAEDSCYIEWLEKKLAACRKAKRRRPNVGGQPRLQPSPEAGCSASPVAQPPRDVSDLYRELLYAVARKFPGESRHETALRYIREKEQMTGEAVSCKQNAPAQAGAVSTSLMPVVGDSCSCPKGCEKDCHECWGEPIANEKAEGLR